jgi:peptidoglycan/LPS O-acetylase OafA/YrhL
MNITERNGGLDLLRSIAILIVLLQHSLFVYPKNGKQDVTSSVINLFDGVSIFFVLSGFLIGTILLRIFIEKEASFHSLLTFWKRRWLRTIPSYYLVMTIVLVLSIVSNTNDTLFKHLSYYFFLQNFKSEVSNFYPEAWSLSIEEWFYVLFPMILFLFTKCFQKNKSIMIGMIFFLFLPLLFRFVFPVNHSDFEFRKLVVYRLDAIVYGVLIANLKFKNNLFFSRTKYHLFTIGLLLLAIISFFKFKNSFTNFNGLFYSFEALSYCLLIPLIYSLNFPQKSKIAQLFYFISTRSYLLYLVNLTLVFGFIIPILKDQFQILNQFPFVCFLLFWIINFLTAEVIYQFYERPILVWKDKNFN